MPLYEYHCKQCRADHELLIRGGERPVCPQCGGERMTKLLSVPAGHVAGGGLPVASREAFNGCGKPGCGPQGCGMGG
jgi:putative FmdB family regulatory protein